jgi:endo-alpha-1,4-polygalactosaminidase (GH114 family)
VRAAWWRIVGDNVGCPGGENGVLYACTRGERPNSDPNSPLHVSTAQYSHYLTLAQSEGTLVFTVDYALHPANAAWVYETSRTLGFVPCVSNRALDRHVEPVPWASTP